VIAGHDHAVEASQIAGEWMEPEPGNIQLLHGAGRI
jgi:hypothetical protein